MPLRKIHIKTICNIKNIDFSRNLTSDFQFFLDHQKDHNFDGRV